MPETMSSKCYLIEKTGDTRTDHINKATITIQSYGESLYEAMSLNELIKNIMLDDLISLDSVAGVKLNSDYNFTDTQTKNYRYQAVFDIVHY